MTRQANLASEHIDAIRDAVRGGEQPDSTDVGKRVAVLKALVSFNTLSEMRKHSPTGAKLGPVTALELSRLLEIVAALEQPKSREHFMLDLELFETLFDNAVHGPDLTAPYAKYLESVYAE